MKVLVAELYLTGKLLNELVKPVLLERYPAVRDLSFEVREGSVNVNASGRYLLMRFSVTAVIEISFLAFNSREHRLEFAVNYQIKPAYINLLIYGNPLAKILQGQPGVTVQGRRVTVDLDQLPQFNLLKQIKLAGTELLSLFEVTTAEFTEHELLFQITLNPPFFPADQP